MLDPVKLCLAPWCSCMQSPVVREDMSYVFCTKEKLDRLESAMKDLTAKKHDIERELNLPQNRERQSNNQLQRWTDKVGEKDREVTQLLDKYSKGCCIQGPCCLNCFSRYRISRDAVNLLNETTQLKGEQVSFIEQQTPEPVPESYKIAGKELSSRLKTIQGYLADETVIMIGIWGMGGVGKTTLLKMIYQLLSDDADVGSDHVLFKLWKEFSQLVLRDDANVGFHHVLFIEVSQNLQLEKLREQITQKLRLPSSAGKDDIFDALKTKNFVLLLDNIWGEVDLNALGIPNPHGDDNSTKQYKRKVIFTARKENVCARMGAGENIIKVECLKPNEAWDLFKDNVNLDAIESDTEFKKIAWQVMEKCGGLPLALKVIGKAMSNKKTVDQWVFILNSLNNSGTEVVQGVQESLLPILKFSYDNLPNIMNIKECFLSASVLQRSSKDNLFGCWMGLGLINDFVNLQEAYGKARYILNILEESCLLYFSDEGIVRLHDVIHEMAMWIASDYGMNRNKWIVKSYDGRAVGTPSTDAENWRFAKRVIISGKRTLLPTLSHRCSDLKCLMIRNNDFSLQNIPEGFFRQMPNLTYLDLSFTAIMKLPKDIKCLVNLQYLNISSTRMLSFPKELIHLDKLQYLICRNFGSPGKVEDGLLSRLQKLKIIDLYPNLSVELKELNKLKKHIKGIGMHVESQEVLQQLSCLPTTQLYLENLDNLISLSFDALSCKDHGYLQELQIRSCPDIKELVMNGRETCLNDLTVYKVEQLQNVVFEHALPQEFFRMLKKLFICKCKLANFAWVLHLPCLTDLKIKSCAEMKMFYVEEEEREIQQQVRQHPTFPALRRLHLRNLPNLVSISNFALDFPRLSWLSVHRCLDLKKLPFKHGINNNQRKISIDCEGELWERLEWEGAAIPSYLRRVVTMSSSYPDKDD